MEENNNEKISVSGADLLKDVVADEKAAKTAPKDTEKDKKDKDKKKDKKEKKTKDGKKFNAKKLKHGTMATVFTCVFVALLVLVNVVTTMLFDRYPITIDLTTNKIYSVSNDTEDYVKKVNVDVQVTIFADENTYTNYSSYNKQAVELLKNYCKLNHHITYRFVDIDSHPEIVKEYTDTISQFDMIFETKTKVDGKEISRTRKLGMLDLLTFTDEFEQKLSQSGYSIDTLAQQAGGDLSFLSYYGSYVESSNAEQAFTSALMTVTDPNPVYVTVLTGRSELTQLTYFQTLLTANGAEKICVGKRAGRHSSTQEEINTLLVEKAAEGGVVLRLKGGDPFVFGRGGEEVLALQAAGIPYEVVSGVSSAVAVPAAAGIPVTHRRLARSFHVITGHTAADGAETLTEQIDTLAKLEGTLVFLMGLHHLEEITNGLLQGGKPADTPAAVISGGTTPKQRVVRAKLCNLAAKTRKANLAAPAVIVIGETAEMQLSGTIKYPLYGVKIGVTGTKSITKKLRNRLEELGAAVTELDYATLVPDWENEALEQALQSITAYTWAVFTSPNGVEIFFQALQKRRIDIRTLAQLRFAVIGTGTAAALEKRGIYPAFLPKTYDVESLAKGLCSVVGADEKILILRAAQGSPVLTEILAKEKKQYTDVKLYDIAIDAEKRRFAHEAAKEMDFITFASGSGVRGFFAQGGTMPQGTTAVCIGTSTAKTLASYGDFPALTAQTFNVDGIIEVILEEASKTKTTEKETDK